MISVIRQDYSGQRRTDFEPPFMLKEMAIEKTSKDQEKTNESGRLESANS